MLVIIDKLTKYTEIILFKEIYIVLELSYILLDILIKHYGILALIISDRDKLFIVVYYTTLITVISIKRKLLIAFYL